MLMTLAVPLVKLPVREGPVAVCFQSMSGRVCTKVGTEVIFWAELQGFGNVAVPVGVACFSKL